MRSVQQGLKDDGFAVPMTKLCRWFEVARRTMYYKPSRAPAKVKPELARANQGDDRGRTVVRVSHGRCAASYEQEHGAADLPTERLAGPQARTGTTPTHRGESLPRRTSGSALGHGPVPCMGWQGRLAQPGAGDRLPHPTTVGLASVANRPCQHRLRCPGAGADHALRRTGASAGRPQLAFS